jgi:hypothetical protein
MANKNTVGAEIDHPEKSNMQERECFACLGLKNHLLCRWEFIPMVGRPEMILEQTGGKNYGFPCSSKSAFQVINPLILFLHDFHVSNIYSGARPL